MNKKFNNYNKQIIIIVLTTVKDHKKLSQI